MNDERPPKEPFELDRMCNDQSPKVHPDVQLSLAGTAPLKTTLLNQLSTSTAWMAP